MTYEQLQNLKKHEAATRAGNRSDYSARRIAIVTALFDEFGAETYETLLAKLYNLGHSANEISDLVLAKAGQAITARSIARELNRNGIELREIKTAFRNAISRGRVSWAYREHKNKFANRKQLSKKTRFEVLTRDSFKCVLCGSKETLEVDHIVPRVEGGSNELKNLRTLCHDCNVGKRLCENEKNFVGGFKSGK